MTALEKSSKPPRANAFVTSPLRNRLRLDLHAPPSGVWKLVGDLSRFPEYSKGLDRVDAKRDAHGDCAEYVCFFKPMEPGSPGVEHREVMRWFEPDQGFASEAEEPNAFGISRSLTRVTLEPSAKGTILTWDQHYDADDLAMMRAEFDRALGGISEQLLRRFGGRVTERFVDGP